MDSFQAAADPGAFAGALLRAMRAHARLSQRELARRAGLPPSTIAGAEGAAGSAPSWASMVRAAAACGCLISVCPADQVEVGVRLGPWQFDGVRDQGARHLPAHLDVWRLGRASEWSSFHKYSCYANPPFPTYSFQMRPRRPQR
jgi:transcriptional regulator with XRE-family HTH domain